MGDEDLRCYCCQFREILMQIHDDIPFHHLLGCFILGLQYWPEVYLQMDSYFQQGVFDNWMQVFHMVKDIAGKINHSQPISDLELVGACACDEHDDNDMPDLQSMASEESEVCAYCDSLGHIVNECQVLEFHNLKAAEVEACSYCNLKGHKVGECQVLEYCKLHNLCTYCKMQGHSIQECQQASDFHRDFHEHQRQKLASSINLKCEVRRPDFSYAQEHVLSNLFDLPESSTSVSDEVENLNVYRGSCLADGLVIQRSDAAYIIQNCNLKEMSNEEGSEEMQESFDMPGIHLSCFEDPQGNNPAPKECDGDDEVSFDIADLFEEPVHEEGDISQASACHLRPMYTAYNDAISLTATPSSTTAFVHKPSVAPKALLPTTASTNFPVYNIHFEQTLYPLLPAISENNCPTKTISFDHTLPLPKPLFTAIASFEPTATHCTNAVLHIANTDQYPVKFIFCIFTFEALSTVKKSPAHFTIADLPIPELPVKLFIQENKENQHCIYLPTCLSSPSCFEAQKSAPFLLLYALNILPKTGIG